MHLRTLCGTQPEQYPPNPKLPCFLARQRPRNCVSIASGSRSISALRRASLFFYFCLLGSSGNHRQLLLFICHQDGFGARLSSIFFWRRVVSTKAEIFLPGLLTLQHYLDNIRRLRLHSIHSWGSKLCLSCGDKHGTNRDP